MSPFLSRARALALALLASFESRHRSSSAASIATFCVETNALGTAHVLEAALSEGPSIRKVVYAASSTFYGNQPVPHGENLSFSATSPYAATKFQGELEMLTWDSVYDIPTLSLRFFMVYGPRQPTSGAYAIVTGLFQEAKQRNASLVVEGSGLHFRGENAHACVRYEFHASPRVPPNPQRDFIHVHDIARGLVMGFQSAVHGMPINLGSGHAVRIQDLADMVSPNQAHLPPRPHDLEGTLADTCRAKALLNFEAREDFTPTMRAMVETPPGLCLDSTWWPLVILPNGRPATNASREERNSHAIAHLTAAGRVFGTMAGEAAQAADGAPAAIRNSKKKKKKAWLLQRGGK